MKVEEKVPEVEEDYVNRKKKKKGFGDPGEGFGDL